DARAGADLRFGTALAIAVAELAVTVVAPAAHRAAVEQSAGVSEADGHGDGRSAPACARRNSQRATAAAVHLFAAPAMDVTRGVDAACATSADRYRRERAGER